MAVDYNKLIDDLKVGKELAKNASQGEDGGSANLDFVYLKLKGAREKKVKEAFEKAGLDTHKTRYFGIPVYSVNGISGGQGNANVRATEAMKKYLDGEGWDVGIIYILD